jgi:hypothetical protein
MSFKTISFIIVALLSFSSCEKKGDVIEMYINETGCANPWNIENNENVIYDINAPDYQNKIQSYLEQKNIEIKEISITNDGPLSGCFSCFCSTGRRIKILIYESDKLKASEIGFY